MNTYKIKSLKDAQCRIQYYRSSMLLSTCSLKKQYLQSELLREVNYVSSLIEEIYNDLQCTLADNIYRQTKEFSLQELQYYDGSEGKPAYVAVNGIVYDVSNEPTWGGATHFGLVAGKDLTAQFNSCHGVESILSKLPVVGALK